MRCIIPPQTGNTKAGPIFAKGVPAEGCVPKMPSARKQSCAISGRTMWRWRNTSGTWRGTKSCTGSEKRRLRRVFADAKEKHGIRYTQYGGLAQVTNWVKLKFAIMNLKKLATWKWNGRHPAPDGGKRSGLRENTPDISLLFPFSFRFANQKPALA